MKKLIVVFLLAFAGYKGYIEHASKNSGAFNDAGVPQVLLFTVEGCGKPCADANKLLKKRKVDYQEIVVTDGDEQLAMWQSFGSISTMPVLVAGEEKLSGYNKWKYVSALAVNFDNSYLYTSEAKMFDKNFTAQGEPKLVMYTMDGCGYCEAAIHQLREDGIAFEERNTSTDFVAKSELDKYQAGTPLIFYGYRRYEGWGKDIYESLHEVL